MRRAGTPLRHAAATSALFAVLHGAYFSPVLLSGRLLAPGDAVLHTLPAFIAPHRFWDQLFSGYPAVADPQNMAWYPLALLLPRNGAAWNLLVLAAYVLAGCFTYGYVHTVTRSKQAAAAAGIVYSFSAFLMAHLGHTAMLHSAAWLPLIVWSIEQLRARVTVRWIAAGAAGVACSALAGHPQVLVFTLGVTAAYTLAMGWGAPSGPARHWGSSALTVALGLGMAAVLLIPLAELARLSVRQRIDYQTFVSLHLPLSHLPLLVFPYAFGGSAHGPLPTTPYWGSWNLGEIQSTVGLLPLGLAVLGLVGRPRRIVWFWAAVGTGAFLLALGPTTPLSRLAFHVPVYGRFKAPGRHALEVTMAVSVLAGMGVATVLSQTAAVRRRLFLLAAAAVALAVAAALAGLWLLVPDPGDTSLGPGRALLGTLRPWRNLAIGIPLGLGAAGAVALWLWCRKPTRARAAGLLLVLAADVGSFGWFATWQTEAQDPRVLRVPAALEPYRAAAVREHQRLGPLLGIGQPPEAAVPNLSSAWDVPNFSGYNPLLLARYGALTGMRTDGLLTLAELGKENRALDLLAARYVLVPTSVAAGKPGVERGGMRWSADDLGIGLGKGCGGTDPDAAELEVPDVPADRIGLVTSLACSAGVPDGEEVLRVTITPSDGAPVVLSLRAGTDTAEFAWQRPDVRERTAHRQAEVFDAVPGEAGGKWQAQRYMTRLDLPGRMHVRSVRVERVGAAGAAAVGRISLSDRSTGGVHAVTPATRPLAALDRWRRVGGFGETAVFENRRALPRAWVVGTAATMGPEAIRRTIRTSTMPDGSPFDPTRTALLEEEPPALGTGGAASARVLRVDDTVVDVKARTASAALLVTSDVHYPGWRVTVDGSPARLLRVDYVLRGVHLPPGVHTVRFEFRPRSFVAGAAVSAASLLVTLALVGGAALRSRNRGR